MSFLNKTAKGFLFVISWIITYLEVYLLATVITNFALGTAVLTVSIFSTVPPILADNYWILFLIVSIPISVILLFIVILKMRSLSKEAKERNKALHAKEDPYTSQEPERKDKDKD